MRRLRRLVPLLLAFASLQCVPDFLGTPRQPPPPPGGRRAQILLTPASATLTTVGGGLTLRATVLDAQGIVMLGRPVTWTSLNPDVATIDSTSGAVVAVRSGQVVVAASAPVGEGGAWIEGYTLLTVAAPSAVPLGSFAPGPAVTGAQLNAVWGASASEVYAVGDNGTILRYDGAAWTSQVSPTTEQLWGVWGFGSMPAECALSHCAAASARAYAVGERGTIFRLTGADTWTTDTSGTAEALSAVWGASPRDVFAVGAAGTILHFDSAWVTMASGTTRNLRAVWGTSSANVYAVGGGGAILHYDGTQWAEESSVTSALLTGIWGAGPDEIYVSAADGSVLRGDGTTWATVVRDTTTQLYVVWGASSREVYAAGSGGVVLLWDGSAWTRVPTSTAATLRSLWGTSESPVHAVGAGGALAAAARGGAFRLVVADMTLGSLRVGTPIAAEVRIVDAAGHTVSGASDTVRLALGRAPAGAALVGTTAVAAHDGIAVFSHLLVTRPGSDYALVATAAGLPVARTPSFAVAPGALRWLQFATQPTTVAVAGTPFTPVVEVAGQDTFGNRLPLPDGIGVTVSSASGSIGGFLGDTSGIALQGVVSFSSLRATKVGSGRRLRASTTATGLIHEAVSDTFAVLGPGPAATLAVAPAGIVLSSYGTADSLRVTVAADSFGNHLPLQGVTWRSENPAVVAVDASTGAATAVASGQTAVAATIGAATDFATVTVSLPGAPPVRSWTPVASGTTHDLLAIWAYSATKAWVQGDSVFAWLDGAGWHTIPDGQIPYAAIAGSGPDSVVTYTGQGSCPAYLSGLNPSVTNTAVWYLVIQIFASGACDPQSVYPPGGVWMPNPRVTWVFHRLERVYRVWSGMVRDSFRSATVSDGIWFNLNDGWGTSELNVWAVGDAGTRLHYDGNIRTVLRGGNERFYDFNAVWGASSSDVFAVGSGGTIYHWDGAAWALMDSGTTMALWDVWGTSGTDVYAVGRGGLILRYDGAAWSPMASGTTQDLRGVFGVPSGEVFVVGHGGTILQGTR